MNITEKDALKLLELVRRGSHKDVSLFMDALVTPNGKRLLAEVQRLLEGLSAPSSVMELEMQGELASTAAYRCQNATEQLAYLVNEGKKSVDKTISIAEDVQSSVLKLKRGEGNLEVICDQINGQLLDLIVLQGYQDLSEQVIIKLKRFIGDLEKNLAQVVDLNMANDVELDMGPAVTFEEVAAAMSDQDAIDELINNEISANG